MQTNQEPEKKQVHTVKSILDASINYLSAKKVFEPEVACRLILSRILSCKHLDLIYKHNNEMTEKQVEAIRRALRRLAAHEPVQYILGDVEFMGHIFKIDKRALIPRPETEVLVELVIKNEPVFAQGNASVLDIGTGSGCIPISLALAAPGNRFIGTDISPQAIELATENAIKLGVSDRVAFTCDDLSDILEPCSIDIVTSNPPYVTTEECYALLPHIKNYEPRTALDGGVDGLAILSSVVEDAACVLKTGGSIYLEIGLGQAKAVTSILQAMGFEKVKVAKDLTGRERIVTGKLSS